MYDLRPFVKDAVGIVESHYLGETGKYARWDRQNAENSRDLGPIPYGCANAANILYTLHELPADQEEQAKFVRVLQAFQDKETGLFTYPGNYSTHTTAFLNGALDLLGAKPLYKAKGFAQFGTREGLNKFLDGIDWAKEPWLGAHLGAGIYGSMVLSGQGGDEWEDAYFDWLNENADPATGLWKKGFLEGAPRFHYIAAAFHYVFNYEYARRALPYPKELLDTCIRAYREGECIDFAKSFGWPDIDFTYLLARVQRRAGVRYEETQEILREIEDGLVGQLLNMNVRENESLNDLNTLFAIVSALAVLQDALPGTIRTSKPLMLVLDRRPFV